MTNFFKFLYNIYHKALVTIVRKKDDDVINFVIFDYRKIYLLSVNEINKMKEEKKKEFIESFEGYINENLESSSDIWKSVDEISSFTGTTCDNVIKYVESFDEFVKNSEGKYTTRNEYMKKTPSWKKIVHVLRHKI